MSRYTRSINADLLIGVIYFLRPFNGEFQTKSLTLNEKIKNTIATVFISMAKNRKKEKHLWTKKSGKRFN